MGGVCGMLSELYAMGGVCGMFAQRRALFSPCQRYRVAEFFFFSGYSKVRQDTTRVLPSNLSVFWGDRCSQEEWFIVRKEDIYIFFCTMRSFDKEGKSKASKDKMYLERNHKTMNNKRIKSSFLVRPVRCSSRSQARTNAMKYVYGYFIKF